MMIQDIQNRGGVKNESPVPEKVEVIPSENSSGIATQLLNELLKNESLDSSVHIERKNTFDTEEDNITIEKTIPG